MNKFSIACLCLVLVPSLCLGEPLKNGVVKEEYADGRRGEISYKDGKRQGIARTFFPEGQLASEENFEDDALQGPIKTYYRNGRLMMEGRTKKGKLDGKVRYYFEDGKLWDEKRFRNGKLLNDRGRPYNGVYTEKNENGGLHREITYKDGEMEGDYKLYYDDGKLLFEGIMAKGKLQKRLFP